MKHSHRHGGGRNRQFSRSGERPDHLHHHHDGEHSGRGRRGGGRHAGRPFDYGELRLLVLAMIAERPRHGYELIKDIEEKFGGSYSPSPGVIYPTLTWLDDMGFAAIEPQESGRKLYNITKEGEAFLTANRAAVDEIQARIGTRGEGREHIPAPVIRAMENLKVAMRLRFRRGPIDQKSADSIAAALDAAAQTVERN